MEIGKLTIFDTSPIVYIKISLKFLKILNLYLDLKLGLGFIMILSRTLKIVKFKEDHMAKKVLIISTSLRNNSNSEALADAFLQGSEKANNEVEKISLKNKSIAFCKG